MKCLHVFGHFISSDWCMRKLSGKRVHVYLQYTSGLPELNRQAADTEEVLTSIWSCFKFAF